MERGAGSSGQSRSSVVILRASHTSAQMAVIVAERAGEEEDKEGAKPAEAEKGERPPPLLGTLRGGSLDLARSAAFLARWVA